MHLQTRLNQILDHPAPGDVASRAFDIFMMTLIGLNAVALMLETVKDIGTDLSRFFRVFEAVSVLVFSVEYVLRLWACRDDPRYASPIVGRIRYGLTPLMVIDLLAVLPFYLRLLLPPPFNLDFRIFRLARLAKLARYSRALRTLGRALRAKRQELLATLLILLFLLVVASSLLYIAEQGDPDTEFKSIPEAMWWGVATLTTVGYGDMVPATPLGKLMAGVVGILGIAMVALPTGILGAAFTEELRATRKARKARRVCPHCGKEI